MRISFLTPHLEIRGANRRIIELSNHLVEKGHQVTIFHSDGSSCKWMECKAEIKPSREVKNLYHQVLISINRKDYPLFKKAKAKLKIFYVLLLYETEKKYLTGFHPTLILPFRKYPRWFRAVLRDKKILKLSNSTGLQSELKKFSINTILLLGGVNQGLFYPIKNEKLFQWKVLCVGDPLEWKGTEIVSKAVEIAKGFEPQITLISYYGKDIPQNKLAEVYHAADIFVDAQWQGGWNNPVAEAMACKIPVVCSDSSGIKDFAFNEKTALVVPPKNPEAMAKAILRLGKDREMRERLRENAYNHITQYSWEKSAENLEKIIKFCLTSKLFL
jgi:glycosyltransferase involved in cell wall biosynthesis